MEMYKRDPRNNSGIKPIRKGVFGHTLMVEELGHRKVNHGDVYVLRFYNQLDGTAKGEIACATVAEAHKWMETFDHAKKQAEHELLRCGSSRNILNMKTERINLEGHRHSVRRYAHGLRNLIRIGQGPEILLRKCSNVFSDGDFQGDDGDVIQEHAWKCVRMVNGMRIFEDLADSKSGKRVLVKAVAVVDASAETVFEVILNTDQHQRYEWDMMTGDLELVDSLSGNYDVVHGTHDCKCSSRRRSRRDFVFSRQWFRGQDGTYTILQFPAEHRKCPPKSGFRRTKVTPSTWEIRSLDASSSSNNAKCILTQMLEVNSVGWCKWRNNQGSKFEKTVPYALLSQVAGLKEYIESKPSLKSETSTTFVHSRFSIVSASNDENEDSISDVSDQFYDAIASDSSSSSDDEDGDIETEISISFIRKNQLNILICLALESAPDLNKELDPSVLPIILDPNHYHGSLHQGQDETDTDCWTSPSASGFMIRGETYFKDNSKVMGGVPLLKLIAVDWLKVDNCFSKVALHPSSLVQSQAGKILPFVLILNLQIPAKPNYSLCLYYAADRPVNKNSLLGKFIDGSDEYRDSRFKLIPRIVEGYWMVKRAVGTKACLLGKGITCRYLRQDNFLEIDADIGSSSVARSVIGLVLGYVTSLVTDLAILIEAKEEDELPEYILGTVRLNRLKLTSAVSLEV
ncbi:hypothetical protein NMG60_11013138 [Bertholletia excelsa]